MQQHEEAELNTGKKLTYQTGQNTKNRYLASGRKNSFTHFMNELFTKTELKNSAA